MAVHLYLSLIPEALIASMLAPADFGAYYATGTARKARGQAIFFELDPAFRHEFFRIDEGMRRCSAHEGGRPDASTYISVYRVLEHVDLAAIRRLHLVTKDGRTLGLESSARLPAEDGGLYLYQEIAPVHPLVVSALAPREFYERIVLDPDSLVSLPALAFLDLSLGELAHDAAHGAVRDLPYANVGHLRDCLLELRGSPMHTKMVDRFQPAEVPFRAVRSGLFVGNRAGLRYFPLLPEQELLEQHYAWWRSARMHG